MQVSVDTYQGRVSIRTLYEAAQLIRRGAITDNIIHACYEKMDRDFNVHMAAAAAAREDLRHVYDWGLVGSPSGRLWQTSLIGNGSNRTVGFVFLPSRKRVPIDPELEGRASFRRHIFTDKATVFEQGQEVNISRKYAKFLVYINRHKGMGTTATGGKSYKSNGVTFTENESMIESAGGGKYQHKFTAEFAAFWSNLGSVEEIATKLAGSSAVQMARAAGAEQRKQGLQKKMGDAAPEAKARAQNAIKRINRQMRNR